MNAKYHSVRRRRIALVLQESTTDCGPAVTLMLASAYGKVSTLTEIKPFFPKLEEGATLERIGAVLEQLGLQTYAFELRGDELPDQKEPFITSRGPHFLVVEEVKNGIVWYLDPAFGRKALPVPVFLEGWSGICLFARELDQGLTPPEVGKPRKIDLAFLSTRFKGVLFVSVFASLLISGATVGLSFLTKRIYDEVIPGKNLDLGLTILVAWGSVQIFSHALTFMRDLVVMRLAMRLQVDFSVDLYRHILRLPFLRVANRLSGDLLGRLRDVSTVRTFITDQLVLAVIHSLLFVFSLIFFVWISPKVAAFSVIIGCGSVLVSLLSLKFLYQRNQELFAQQAAGEEMVIEQSRNFLVLKSFGAEAQAASNWRRQMERVSHLGWKTFYFTRTLGLLEEFVGLIGNGGMIFYGAYLVMRGELTLGWLVSLGTLFGIVVSSMETLAHLLGQLQSVRASRDRLDEILCTPTEVSTVGGPELSGLQISYENISFSYDPLSSYDSRVLKNISFAVEAGETIGIVGPTGSGKTTLSLLLNRLLDPSEGIIKIGGVDHREYSISELRNKVALVTQSPCLTVGTVLENIALGELQPDLERAWEAARLAKADDFIRGLPGEMQFKLGQDGLGLSGGERQRLAVARALYRNPPILIFDEMTSSLDRETERGLLQELSEVLKGRTSFIISHRISSLRLCQRILFVQKGELKGFAPLAELRRSDDAFRRLMTDDDV